jgi:UDP-N-acetylmuramyl pentapeptide synthase
VLKLDHAAQQQTQLDYIHEVEHRGERILRLDKAIDEALERAPASMSAVIAALQALRGVAKITAVIPPLTGTGRLAIPRAPSPVGHAGSAAQRAHCAGAYTPSA